MMHAMHGWMPKTVPMMRRMKPRKRVIRLEVWMKFMTCNLQPKYRSKRQIALSLLRMERW